MSKNSEEVLKTIEKNKITPQPKWRFISQNYIVWFFFFVFLIFSSLAISTILFLVTTHDWDVYDYLGRTFISHVFISIPYFWIIVFGLLILIAYYIFAQTKYGYRHTISRIFLGSIIAGSILGLALFSFGVDSEVHEFFSKNVPFYDKLIYYKEDIWDKPERGLLSGEVTDIKNRNEFTIRDFKGNTWQIIGENILWPDDLTPQKGVEVKIIGQQQFDDTFQGKVIRSW